jgi:hypothetical protein
MTTLLRASNSISFWTRIPWFLTINKSAHTQWRPTRKKFNITSNNCNKILQFRHTELNNSNSYHYTVNIRRIQFIYNLTYIKYTSYIIYRRLNIIIYRRPNIIIYRRLNIIIYRRLNTNKHNMWGSWYLKTTSFKNTSFLFPLYIWATLTIGLIMECYYSWNI